MAIGVANGLSMYAQYSLIQVFYRLYFAGWYVAAVAVVTGLVYGAVGGWLGASLGFRLRRTAR